MLECLVLPRNSHLQHIMEASLRRKLFALTEKVEGKDISIMKEVRIDNLMDEMRHVSTQSLETLISQVLSRPIEEVQDKLSDPDSQALMRELVERLGGTPD